VRLAFVVLLALAVAFVVYRMAQPDEPPPPPKIVEQKKHDCRDLCEQTMIVEKLDETYLKNCRARCDGPAPPHEVPSRITVAPADHSRTLKDERTLKNERTLKDERTLKNERTPKNDRR
jgi:hypothetical protein